MSDAPILVFGAAGQVGRELVGLAASRGIPLEGATRVDADVSDADAVAALIARHRPRLVVNAAAYTAVDKAESDPDAAARGNADGPRVLAEATAAAGLPLLHLSTDYVFDGSKPGAYTEDDPIAPLGVYGRTKAEGEAEVRANPRHVILRTAWVYGVYGNNFLKTMMRLAGERDRLRVVADQQGSPTATADIAAAILAIDAALARDPHLAGTFHFVGAGGDHLARICRGDRRGAGASHRQAPDGRGHRHRGLSHPRRPPRQFRARLVALHHDLRLSSQALAGAHGGGRRRARCRRRLKATLLSWLAPACPASAWRSLRRRGARGAGSRAHPTRG